ncbi:MAG: hypothetical protein N2449_09810 [Bacteroidales bacterium]|nr:hypothetical protein [Bacteroidales bacterium]
MGKKILFRLDAGSTVGLGHLSRCYALAQQLLGFTATIVFYIKGDLNIHLAKKLTNNQIEIFYVDDLNPTEWYHFIQSQDIVVIDSYELNDFHFRQIKALCKKLILITDFKQDVQNVDAIVNTSIENKQNKNTNIPFFFGVEYALLRKAFLSELKHNAREGILISMGGSDPSNLTLSIINELLKIKIHQPIHVLYTLSYSTYQINEFLKYAALGLIRTHCNLEPHEVAKLMDECKYGVFPASNTLMEALKRQVICGYGYYTDNQFAFYQTITNKFKGANFFNFHPNTLQQSITQLFSLTSPDVAFSEKISSKLNELVNFLLHD